MQISKDNVPFTQVANVVLTSPKISLKAKGLYAYLFSKPDTWEFSSHRMEGELKESHPTIVKLLRELEHHCLLMRKRQKNGKVEYFLTYSMCDITPSKESLLGPELKKAQVKILHSEESLPISNIDNTSNIEEESNTDNTASQSDANIPLIIDLFKEVNPSYKRLFGNPPQRAATRRSLETHGFDRLSAMIAFLPKSNASRYAPTITTPIQFEQKLGELIAWSKKQKDDGGKGNNFIL